MQYTVSQAARRFGVSPSTIAYRASAGYVGEDLILPPNDNKMLRHLRWFDVDGERKYASDWARQWGVSHHTAVNYAR